LDHFDDVKPAFILEEEIDETKFSVERLLLAPSWEFDFDKNISIIEQSFEDNEV
jgi:hypothetical protein